MKKIILNILSILILIFIPSLSFSDDNTNKEKQSFETKSKLSTFYEHFPFCTNGMAIHETEIGMNLLLSEAKGVGNVLVVKSIKKAKNYLGVSSNKINKLIKMKYTDYRSCIYVFTLSNGKFLKGIYEEWTNIKQIQNYINGKEPGTYIKFSGVQYSKPFSDKELLSSSKCFSDDECNHLKPIYTFLDLGKIYLQNQTPP